MLNEVKQRRCLIPCYEMTTVEVKFSLKSFPYLLKAIEEIKKESPEFSRYSQVDGNKIYVASSYERVELDLEKSEASFQGGNEGLLNRIKRKYSEIVIAEVAKKKRFAMTMKNNKIQLKKW